MVKNPPPNAEDSGLIPESGRSSRKGNGNHSSILAWEIHGHRSLKGYSLWGHKELDMIELLSTHIKT